MLCFLQQLDTHYHFVDEFGREYLWPIQTNPNYEYLEPLNWYAPENLHGNVLGLPLMYVAEPARFYGIIDGIEPLTTLKSYMHNPRCWVFLPDFAQKIIKQRSLQIGQRVLITHDDVIVLSLPNHDITSVDLEI